MLIEFEVKMAVEIPLEDFGDVQGDCDNAQKRIMEWKSCECYDNPDLYYIHSDSELIKKAAQELVEYQKRHPFSLKLSDVIKKSKQGQRYRRANYGELYTFKDGKLYEGGGAYNTPATFHTDEIETVRFRDVETENEE